MTPLEMAWITFGIAVVIMLFVVWFIIAKDRAIPALCLRCKQYSIGRCNACDFSCKKYQYLINKPYLQTKQEEE